MALATILRTTPQKTCVAFFQTSAVTNKARAGRYRVTAKKNKPLTYEMSLKPHEIAHKKGWNSWNTSNLIDGNRSSETAVEDMFIRRFMNGTWPLLLLSEIIIKRQINIIRVAGILKLTANPRQIYFLTGYSEEFLSYWLQCPVKLEIQLAKRNDVIFKYI
ncbi:28S ribosomal protein S24, mitochondrial [Leptopilina heterotoma]|uniref:28S ribosomal protein S24, mitochondrial n=1 Tax=Leptopilina heterotoma TaxID=63436 RepID=UPI001CA8D0AF|nr:28S ribosomal protein S24, mitochondrial [Leptopilina heterotoma]